MKTNLRLRKTDLLTILVQSEVIDTVCYFPAAKSLYIELKNKTSYSYEDVPATIVFGLINSKSKGSYFNKYIKNKFEYTKVG